MDVHTEQVTMYATRRERLATEMGEGLALIGSCGVSPDPSLFDKNLLYLTGNTSRKAQLLLAPRGVTIDRLETQHGPEVFRGRVVREVLFVEEPSAYEKRAYGKGLTMDAVRYASGVEAVLPLSILEETLNINLLQEKVLWVNIPTCPSLGRPLTPDLVLINQIKERFVWLQINNIAPLIHEMRRVKEPYEIACLHKAYEIHTEIYEKIMRTLKPGDNESVGEAIWHYEAKAHHNPNEVSCEAQDLFPAHIIVAAGESAVAAAYSDNNRVILDGDMVLIDAGIEYKGYSSDISRTFPANGKFTPRQRELYQIVLEAQKLAAETLKPGSTARDAHRAIYEHYRRHNLESYGFGLGGHPVGLNIHDATGFSLWDQDQPFEPGVVITLEPMLNIPEEGLGIRIEDGFLITEDAYEIMTGPPKEVDEVEALCRRN